MQTHSYQPKGGSYSQKSTSLDGIRVVYDNYSDHLPGPALVFIHGYTCSSALWSAQHPLLTTHRALAIDLPGHGRSDAPQIEYTMELFARAVEGVLAAECVTSTVLVGHSMGGPVATMTLRLNPKLVKAIVYVDSFFELPESFLSRSERQALAAKRVDDAFFGNMLNGFWAARTTDVVRQQVIKTMMGTPKHVRVNTCTTDVQPHAWREGEVYDVPALVVNCPMFPVDERWKKHISGLEVTCWAENGHFLFMEDAERFNTAVDEWLRENRLMGVTQSQ
ncbi:uncharacterized protein HMPREF1541_05528 [Cyphellophora europaea CBS 101466]|uniref:AB hydrolase-1 domain-containing protein n=1 Tax=Cyphellophora europaea (strain CBS 101466) TaxID=1220924 RepID=W2RSL5_CYPE1|nr:uncharacterized protein HMPREF1541_05528 [Cyphellophora europaea CBS 101466]ETN39305.1 hypothetical protein HMPREF1541_05528 [Cyphellophora europaea CBS 101466]